MRARSPAAAVALRPSDAWDRRRFLRAAGLAGIAGAAALAGCADRGHTPTPPSLPPATPAIPRGAPRALSIAWTPRAESDTEAPAWTPLIDDALWSALLDAVERAERSIAVSQLYFDPAFAPRGEPLADRLEAAADRGVDVRVLLNRGTLLEDDAEEAQARFAGTGVAFRARRFWPNVLHAKVMVVDGADAFLVDPPFQDAYLAADQRAVSVRVEGAPARQVGAVFDALWDARPLTPLPAPAPAASDEAGVGIAWSAPPGVLDGRPSEGIFEAYVDAIGRARSLIYLETQYFTSPAIAAALRAALDREPGLHVVLRLNWRTDIVSYDERQRLRLAELGHPDEPRVHVSYDDGYVHSKVGIVDDAWATIGSANLDAVSLHESDGALHPRWCNVDANAVMRDGGPGGAVAALRRALWERRFGDAPPLVPGP